MLQLKIRGPIVIVALLAVAQTGYGQICLITYGNGMENTCSGTHNTGIGNNVFDAITTGDYNTAAGASALQSNTTGSNNTAYGYQALISNTSGKGNAAQGVNALYSNTTGIRNLGIGSDALYSNTSGGYNIALGFEAGYNVTTGSNNIEIGTSGTASDNGTIQIGMQGTQTLTTIAGIYGTPITGSAVYVTATGQLGVLASSERYKTDIAPIGANTEKLKQLRAVSFHFRTDPHGAVQYGLIAEEVAAVYPELVIRDGAGIIQGVHYEELAPILLTEVQRQAATIAVQAAKYDALNGRSDAQAAEIHDLKKLVVEMQAGLLKLQAKEQLVAQR
jgi:Chaperone of endosialidase